MPHKRLTHKNDSGEWEIEISEGDCSVYRDSDDRCYIIGAIVNKLAYYEDKEYGEDE